MEFETLRILFQWKFHDGIPTIQLGEAKVERNESENYADFSDYQLINRVQHCPSCFLYGPYNILPYDSIFLLLYFPAEIESVDKSLYKKIHNISSTFIHSNNVSLLHNDFPNWGQESFAHILNNFSILYVDNCKELKDLRNLGLIYPCF